MYFNEMSDVISEMTKTEWKNSHKFKYDPNKSKEENAEVFKRIKMERYDNKESQRNIYNQANNIGGEKKEENGVYKLKKDREIIKDILAKEYPSVRNKDLPPENKNFNSDIKELKDIMITSPSDLPLKEKIVKDSLSKNFNKISKRKENFSYFKDPRTNNISEPSEEGERKANAYANKNFLNKKDMYNKDKTFDFNKNFYLIVPTGFIMPISNSSSTPLEDGRTTKGVDGVGSYNGKIFFVENKSSDNPSTYKQEFKNFKQNCFKSGAIPVINYDKSISSNKYRNPNWSSSNDDGYKEKTQYLEKRVINNKEITRLKKRLEDAKTEANKEKIRLEIKKLEDSFIRTDVAKEIYSSKKREKDRKEIQDNLSKFNKIENAYFIQRNNFNEKLSELGIRSVFFKDSFVKSRMKKGKRELFTTDEYSANLLNNLKRWLINSKNIKLENADEFILLDKNSSVVTSSLKDRFIKASK